MHGQRLTQLGVGRAFTLSDNRGVAREREPESRLQVE
jgi:hypothetical protein